MRCLLWEEGEIRYTEPANSPETPTPSVGRPQRCFTTAGGPSTVATAYWTRVGLT